MNIFRVPSHGQPLMARQNKSVYLIVVVAAIIVAVFFIFRYIMWLIKDKKTTPEWIAAQKKRVTTKKDVDKLAEKIKLTKDEAQLLWSICKNTKAQNIFYLAEDNEAVDAIFKAEYLSMKERGEDPKVMLMLFRLRHKIDQEIAAGVPITSTNALSEDIRFNCCLNSGQQVSCTLKRKTQEGMLLEIPQQLYDSADRPPELSKAIFTFNYPSITRYEFTARIVRYEAGLSGKPGMFISHSNDLKISAKRGSRRIDYLKKAVFYAVAITEENSHKKYTKKEKAYDCALLNISGGGCCVASALPIKENQFIALDIPINGGTIPTVGRIVETRRLDQNKFALHIAFAQIAPKAQAEIYALTYGFTNAS